MGTFLGSLFAVGTVVASAQVAQDVTVPVINALSEIDYQAIPDRAYFLVDFNVAMQPVDTCMINKNTEAGQEFFQKLRAENADVTDEGWQEAYTTFMLQSPRVPFAQEFLDEVKGLEERQVTTVAVEGEPLRYIDYSNIEPACIVAVHSNPEILAKTAVECQERNIQFIGYLFADKAEKAWDEALVTFQWKHLLTEGQWLNDAEAAERLQQEESTQN